MPGIVKAVGKAVSSVVSTAGKAVSSVASGVSQLGGGIINTAGQVVSGAGQLAGGAINFGVKTVKSVAKTAVTVVTKVTDKVIDVATNIIQNPLPILETVALTYALGPAGAALGSSIGITTTTMAAAVSSATVTAANGGNVQQVATAALATYVSANPGLSGQEKIIASGAIQLASGAKPEDVIRNVIASTASNQILPSVLNKLNTAISEQFPDGIDKTVKSAFINAERQALAATITGQDASQAALAGFAGGTVADLAQWGASVAAPKMEDVNSKSIGVAAGEYAQYKVAGYSDEQALNKAVQGVFSIQTQAAAKEELKKQTAGLSGEQIIAAFSYSQSGQATGLDTGTKQLPPVTVTGESPIGGSLSVLSTFPPDIPGGAKRDATSVRYGGELPPITVTATPELPPVTVYGDKPIGEELSLTGTDSFAAENIAPPSAEEKTPEQLRRDSILLSLINKNFDYGGGGGGTKTSKATPTTQGQGSVGTSALAQALRIGDVGAPIFGRDEEGKKAGWNLESLRYMGNAGE
jgi:hypothetical protein